MYVHILNKSDDNKYEELPKGHAKEIQRRQKPPPCYLAQYHHYRYRFTEKELTPGVPKLVQF